MLKKVLASFMICATLIACESPYESYPKAKAMAENPKLANDFLSNTTIKTFGRGHGTQYEYLASDGTTALIYPGNSGPVRGRWAIRNVGEHKADICFAYGQNSYNPVTKRRGGRWECRSFIDYLYDLNEIYDGDVFGVKSQNRFARPFPKRVNVSIASALQKMGRRPPTGPNKALSKESRN